MDNSGEQLLDAVPFLRTLGTEVVSLSPDEVVLRLPWTPERTTTGGAMNGGALMALADNAGATIAFLNLPEGAVGTTTISSSTNFVRGLREGAATATSRPLHKGRTTIAVETDVTDEEGRLLARVTQTQAVLHPRS